MSEATSTNVTIERREAVMVVHLDDGKANALSFDMLAAIRAAVAEAASDDTVGAVVLHGRPGKFCAGFDLEVMRGGDVSQVVELVATGGDLVRELYAAGVPVVAASTGHALAAGALVLLGCDVRVGGEGPAKVGLNEVAIGMVLPDWAITIAMERLSKRHLQRATATARVMSPAEAVDVGYLDEVVPDDQVLDRAVAIATELAATLDPRAYAGTVRKVRGAILEQMASEIAADRSSGTAV